MSKSKGSLWQQDLSLYRLAKWLVGETAEAHGLAADQLSTLRIRDVWDWYQQHREEVFDQLQTSELRDGLHLNDNSIDLLLELMECPFRAMRLFLPVWHLLVFSAQPPVKVPVKEVAVLVRVEFADGVVRTLCVPAEAPAEFRRSHGYLTMTIKSTAAALADSFGVQSLNALHDWAPEKQASPEFPSVLYPPNTADGYLGI